MPNWNPIAPLNGAIITWRERLNPNSEVGRDGALRRPCAVIGAERIPAEHASLHNSFRPLYAVGDSAARCPYLVMPRYTLESRFDPPVQAIISRLSLRRAFGFLSDFRPRFGDGVWGVLLLCIALLTTSCKTTFSSRRVSDPLPAVARLQAGASIQEEVDQLARPLIQSGEVYGMTVGVLTPDGVTRTYGYGKTGWAGDDRPPRADTVFQIGSVSKLFVASVLALLVEEGKMHYGDTVRSILPPEVQVRKDIGELTLYELVTHTAGLPRQPSCPSQLRDFIAYLFTGHNLYGYIDKEYLYWYLRHHHLKSRERRGYVYSNIGAGLLAHLIEVKTGRSIPELVQEKICGPLNMRDTVYALDAEQQKRLAVGHVGDQPKFMRRQVPLAAWDMGAILHPVGGLYSTAADLLIFAGANLGLRHHPLEPLLASTHQVQIKTPAEDVAFGWLVNYFDGGRSVVMYKHGMVSGYNAYVGMDPDTRVAVVVLCNTFNWNEKIGHNLVLRLSGAFAAGAAGSK
jgi:CubicO group peptidase (beta-lactamase class C family)